MGQGTTTVPAWHALPSVHQDSSSKQAQWLQQSTNVGCAKCLIVVLVGLPLPLQPLHTCCRQVNLYRGLFAVAASVEHNNTLFAACIRASVQCEQRECVQSHSILFLQEPGHVSLCCNKIAEAEAVVSVNEKKWLVMHVMHVHVSLCVGHPVLRGTSLNAACLTHVMLPPALKNPTRTTELTTHPLCPSSPHPLPPLTDTHLTVHQERTCCNQWPHRMMPATCSSRAWSVCTPVQSHTLRKAR